MSEKRSIPCPICKKPVFLGEPEFPFCSERCRLIDLGNWSSEEYRISEPLKDFEIEDKPHREERRHDE
jgi:endogenous inhibitor of DNA gyrase (YacG/DUF329 family)